jgi:hypothetical protein
MSSEPSLFRPLSRPVLALSMLITASCVYPASTTYYEAVDKSWAASSTEGNLAPCPPTEYERVYEGANSVLVVPSYRAGTGQVSVFVQVPHGNPLAFQSWNIRLTPLADPLVQSSIPLRFHMVCGKLDKNSCPDASEGVSKKSTDYVVGIAEIPPEFIAGFLVELPRAGSSPATPYAKPQKFELRTHVLLRGTYGCG